MSDDLTTEVRGILEPGQAALIEGADVTADALDVLTKMVGQVLDAHATLSAQMAAQHTEMLAAIAALVMHDAGL